MTMVLGPTVGDKSMTGRQAWLVWEWKWFLDTFLVKSRLSILGQGVLNFCITSFRRLDVQLQIQSHRTACIVYDFEGFFPSQWLSRVLQCLESPLQTNNFSRLLLSSPQDDDHN